MAPRGSRGGWGKKASSHGSSGIGVGVGASRYGASRLGEVGASRYGTSVLGGENIEARHHGVRVVEDGILEARCLGAWGRRALRHDASGGGVSFKARQLVVRRGSFEARRLGVGVSLTAQLLESRGGVGGSLESRPLGAWGYGGASMHGASKIGGCVGSLEARRFGDLGC
ncbi:hypothetical protein KY290_031635 [Solanum tuberosum]|uniref:Uncharacterized protein n=1 Tax=Solanum tuberosum TaxID=4113 RepID=A0ABQ7UBI3_SOLTU|nr:hypothetical protein KY290_031635 [Solanum tuberosum]